MHLTFISEAPIFCCSLKPCASSSLDAWPPYPQTSQPQRRYHGARHVHFDLRRRQAEQQQPLCAASLAAPGAVCRPLSALQCRIRPDPWLSASPGTSKSLPGYMWPNSHAWQVLLNERSQYVCETVVLRAAGDPLLRRLQAVLRIGAGRRVARRWLRTPHRADAAGPDGPPPGILIF